MQKMRLVSLIFIFFTLAVHALEFGKKTLFNNLRSMNCILILVPLSSKTRYLGHSELNAEFSNSCEMITTLSPFCFKTSNFPTKRSLGARCWPPSGPRICRNRNEVGSEIFFEAGKIFEVRSSKQWSAEMKNTNISSKCKCACVSKGIASKFTSNSSNVSNIIKIIVCY